MKSIRSSFLRRTRLTLAAFSAVLLAGCGGGGGGGSTASAPAPAAAAATGIPQSAYLSIDSFIGYLRNMAPSETSVPLNTGNGTPPVSETALPTQVN
jgi:hypothetical protein